MPSPMSLDHEEDDEDHAIETTDRSNQRRRQRPQRYSVKDYVEAISDNDPDFDSDDDIVGEAVYDEEYLRQRKQKKKISSSSEGDEEYRDEENVEEEDDYEEEEEEEEPDNSLSDDSEEPRRNKRNLPVRGTRRELKLKPVVGLRRSRRATRNRIDYKQYELSDSEDELTKPKKEVSGEEDMEVDEAITDNVGDIDEGRNDKPLMKSSSSPDGDGDGGKRRFLDLNQLAPDFGLDEVSPPGLSKDQDNGDL